MSELNSQIKQFIDAFEIEKARELVRDALKNRPDAETYRLAARVAIDDEQRKTFLERATELEATPVDKMPPVASETEADKKPTEPKEPPTAVRTQAIPHLRG